MRCPNPGSLRIALELTRHMAPYTPRDFGAKFGTSFVRSSTWWKLNLARHSQILAGGLLCPKASGLRPIWKTLLRIPEDWALQAVLLIEPGMFRPNPPKSQPLHKAPLPTAKHEPPLHTVRSPNPSGFTFTQRSAQQSNSANPATLHAIRSVCVRP